MKKPIYLFSDKIKYKRFLNVWNKFPEEGIKPILMDSIIWEMIRDKQIYVYLDEIEKEDPVIIATELPPRRKVLVMF